MNERTKRNPLDLSSPGVRRPKGTQKQKLQWRSLEELSAGGVSENVASEEAEGAASWLDPVSRREFLNLLGASLALAGASACTRQPTERIFPYVHPPEEIIPGRPLYYATAMPVPGNAIGLLVESHMGRPTKVEGNPRHPASLGATDPFAQASILTLYDPDRSEVVSNAGLVSTWENFLIALAPELERLRARNGAGFRLLTEVVHSPTLGAQIRRLLEELPEAQWHQYEPLSRENAWEGARLAFGEPAQPLYRLENAEVIFSLASDFLYSGPGSVRYAREFADRRRDPMATEMNRLYAVEPSPSITGGMAVHRLPLDPFAIEPFARAVAARIGLPVETGESFPEHEKWIEVLARDLEEHRGASLIVAGDAQPPAVHALAHAMNEVLGNVGETVVYIEPVAESPARGTESLRALTQQMESGEVETLVVLGGNPVYTAPYGVGFQEALSRVALRIHAGLYENETSYLCHWHLPESHYLESWSDVSAFDGTVSIIQPLIEPLYRGRTQHEILSIFLGEPEASSYDIVRGYWIERFGAENFERRWEQALHDGLVEGTAHEPRSVTVRAPSWLSGPKPDPAGGLRIVFQPDPTILDGRFANNGWLQELPKPFTKLTWDNAALVSPDTAERLNLRTEDVVELRIQDQTVLAPVWVLPGQADDTVTVHLGYGRSRAGRVGSGRGFNANPLRSAEAPWFAAGLEVRKTGERYTLASTQEHFRMHGRHLARAVPLEDYLETPEIFHEMGHQPSPDESLYPEWRYEGYAWGMSIDLNVCTGCSACVVACQAENNIPIVGKDQVRMGREMHWIRVDRYYEGDLDNPQVLHQPVPCMHCEKAPCEVVCPTEATVHGPEGLNQMIYNRCVGTRYCSNNCPYKVRRFNFYHYAAVEEPVLKLLMNPDVTVRSRGVMEKCTYCIQRIKSATIEAEKEDRRVRDGEIQPACAQACPTNAIVFGDVNDAEALVTRRKAEPRSYALLAELNTQPRTTYGGKLWNPHPELEPITLEEIDGD